MAHQCTKFQVSSFIRFGDIFFHGRFAIGVLGVATIQQCIKFEISMITHYKDMKGDKKCRNWGGLGVRSHSRSSAT